MRMIVHGRQTLRSLHTVGWHRKGCPECRLGFRGREASEWAAGGRASDHGEDQGRVGGDAASQEGPVRRWGIYSPRLGGREAGLGARLTPSSAPPHCRPLLAGAPCPGPGCKAARVTARMSQECYAPRSPDKGPGPRPRRLLPEVTAPTGHRLDPTQEVGVTLGPSGCSGSSRMEAWEGHPHPAEAQPGPFTP